MTPEPLPIRRRQEPFRGLRIGITILAVVALLAGIKLAAAVLVPVVLAISLSYVLMPLVAGLKRALRLPESIGAFVALAVFVATLTAGAIVLQPRATALLDTVPKVTQRLGRVLHGTALDRTSAIRKLTTAAEALDKAAQAGGPAAAPPAPAPGMRDHLLSAGKATLKGLGQAVIVLALSYFLLVSGHRFKNKLVRISGASLSEKKLTVQILDEIDLQIQRYLSIQIGTSALVGVATGLAFFVLGFDNALFWGVAAGILHLVPYVGATVVVVVSAMFAYLQFNSVEAALLVGGTALAIAGVVGLLMVPWLTERVGRINAVATFFSLLLWDWLWGIPGLLLGIPIMMALMSVCARIDSLRPVAELLGAEGTRATSR